MQFNDPFIRGLLDQKMNIHIRKRYKISLFINSSGNSGNPWVE